MIFSRRSVRVLLELVGRLIQHFTKIDQKTLKNWTNLFLEPHDYRICYVNTNLHHQYGIFVTESQTFLCAKRPQWWGARRNGCFRRLVVGGGFDNFGSPSQWSIWPSKLPRYWRIWPKFFKKVKCLWCAGRGGDWLVHKLLLLIAKWSKIEISTAEIGFHEFYSSFKIYLTSCTTSPE